MLFACCATQLSNWRRGRRKRPYLPRVETCEIRDKPMRKFTPPSPLQADHTKFALILHSEPFWDPGYTTEYCVCPIFEGRKAVSSDIPTDPFMALVVPSDRFTSGSGFATPNYCDVAKVNRPKWQSEMERTWLNSM